MRIGQELRDRTKAYASSAVRLYAESPTTRRQVEVLAHQLLRSATSVAANIREASRARSDAEFVSKCEIALQEADESQLWLELLQQDCEIDSPRITAMLLETNELIAILVVMVSRTKARNQRNR